MVRCAMVLSCNDCGRPGSRRHKASGACKLYTKTMGTRSALPRQRTTNNDLAMLVDTSDEWITSRTGISRRWISASESTSGLAAEAAANAVADAGVEPSDINLVISVGSVKKCA
ncbi:MAG: hypothetical protein WCZ48_09845 [Bacillota bacterium]|nr:hypothetical protein [Bacillota bacterium]